MHQPLRRELARARGVGERERGRERERPAVDFSDRGKFAAADLLRAISRLHSDTLGCRFIFFIRHKQGRKQVRHSQWLDDVSERSPEYLVTILMIFAFHPRRPLYKQN